MGEILRKVANAFKKRSTILQSETSQAPHVKIDLVDFWPGFNKEDNYLVRLLRRNYTVELTSKPEFLIYSVFGKAHKKYTCTKIFYTGENVRPDFNECNYAFTFDYSDDPRNYRLPLYAWWAPPEQLIKRPDIDPKHILLEKTKFCNFIYGNPNATKRIQFMQKLSKYKQVDCGGTLLNNIGRVITEMEKVKFIKDYRFTIAFENTEYPGYTTEKLVQPMLVHSMPIYCGNPLIERDFNTKSFLHYNDFTSEDELIDKIIEMDQNEEAYLDYLRQPYYHENQINDFVQPANILRQFEMIFKKDTASTGQNIK
ncbi:MAG TPA: glycosyltransferase family 10 [Chitinophagaceae bacterium]|nr:glycosyltransferase family 10 [Chitinophagaceae bacterium]